MLGSASKLHPPVQLFFSGLQQSCLLHPSVSLVHFSAGFKFKWERWVLFIDLFKLHLSFELLVLLSGRFLWLSLPSTFLFSSCHFFKHPFLLFMDVTLS